MREIKFRVRTLDDKWHYFTITSTPEWIISGSGVQVDEFTGIKDKNGKEIYEGDVVQFFCEHKPLIGTVIYLDEIGSFGAKVKDTDIPFNYFNLLQSKTEIIGNIYENPELLTP